MPFSFLYYMYKILYLWKHICTIIIINHSEKQFVRILLGVPPRISQDYILFISLSEKKIKCRKNLKIEMWFSCLVVIYRQFFVKFVQEYIPIWGGGGLPEYMHKMFAHGISANNNLSLPVDKAWIATIFLLLYSLLFIWGDYFGLFWRVMGNRERPFQFPN